MTTAKAKGTAKQPVGGEVGKKALAAALGVIEIAGKRMARFAREGKKKLAAAEHKEEPKAKAS